jgi:hypothetical protein
MSAQSVHPAKRWTSASRRAADDHYASVLAERNHMARFRVFKSSVYQVLKYEPEKRIKDPAMDDQIKFMQDEYPVTRRSIFVKPALTTSRRKSSR